MTLFFPGGILHEENARSCFKEDIHVGLALHYVTVQGSITLTSAIRVSWFRKGLMTLFFFFLYLHFTLTLSRMREGMPREALVSGVKMSPYNER